MAGATPHRRTSGQGVADCGEYREAAGATTPNVTLVSFNVRFWGKADITQTCGDVRF